MDRKELYAKVQSLQLGDAIRNAFGRSYTNVSNEDLATFIAKTEAANKKKAARKVAKIANNSTVKSNRKIAVEYTLNTSDAIIRLVSTLQGICVISNKDAEFILTGKV